MWEAALDRITSLVGRAFVVGSLVPVLLFTGAGLLSTAAVFGRGVLRPLLGIATAHPVPSGLAALTSVVAMGYLLAIVNPVLKRLLEGAYELGPLTRTLKGWKRRKYVRQREEVQAAAEQAGQIHQRCKDWIARLQALNLYRRKEHLVLFSAETRLAIIDRKVRACADSGQVATIEQLEALCCQLEDLYTRDAPLETIEPIHRRFTELCEDVKGLAQARYARALSDLQSSYPTVGRSADVQATTLGNVMAASWAYAYTRFGIDAAFMWSRLKGCLGETHARSVEDDRIAYDFCVALAGLSALHALVWGTIVVVRWPPWIDLAPTLRVTWPVWQALIPIAGVAGTVVFYLAAVEAARSFGNNLRSSFDLFRFDLLKALHLKLPENIETERKNWGTLNDIFVYGDSRRELVYQHPGEEVKEEPPPEKRGLLDRLGSLFQG